MDLILGMKLFRRCVLTRAVNSKEMIEFQNSFVAILFDEKRFSGAEIVN